LHGIETLQVRAEDNNNEEIHPEKKMSD